MGVEIEHFRVKAVDDILHGAIFTGIGTCRVPLMATLELLEQAVGELIAAHFDVHERQA